MGLLYTTLSRHFCRWVVVLSSWGCLLHAQDYSDAFDALRTLGLPDTSNAEYGSLVREGYDRHNLSSPFPSLGEIDLKGGVWRISPPDSTGNYEMLQFHCVSASLSQGQPHPVLGAVEWNPVSLADDTQAIFSFLANSAENSRLRYSIHDAAGLLLFAAHLDAKNQTDQANKIAKLVFEQVEDRQVVIANAISKLANSEYQSALHSALESQNWKAFSQQVESIANRFEAGWIHHGSARLIAKTAADLTPFAHSTDEEKQLYEFLSVPTYQQALSSVHYRGPWIFPSTNLFDLLDRSETSAALPPEIRSHPQRIIPILIEWLSNSAPTSFGFNLPQNIPTSLDEQIRSELKSNHSSQSHYYFQPMVSPNYSRPTTMGDLACILLQPLIPGLDGKIDRLQFADVARAWSKRTGQFTLAELARDYLQRGNEDQIEAAMAYLTEHGEAEDMPHIESHIINQIRNSSWPDFSLANSYLAIRGDQAQAFVTSLEEEVDTLLDRIKLEDEDRWESVKDEYASGITSLKALVSSDGVNEILTQITSGETSFHQVVEPLLLALKKLPVSEQIETILEAAAWCEDRKISARILGALIYLEIDQEKIPAPAEHQTLWEIMLASDTDMGHHQTFADYAAWHFIFFYSPEHGQVYQRFYQMAGSASREYAIKNVSSVIAGESFENLPPYPSPDDVTDSRQQEITSQLLALKDQPDGLREALASRTLAEQLWVTHPPDSSTKDEPDPLRDLVASLQFTLATVDAPPSWEKLIHMKGTQLDQATLTQILDLAKEQLTTGERFEISIERSPGFSPYEIRVKSLGPDFQGDHPEMITAMTSSLFNHFEQELAFTAIAMSGASYSLAELLIADDEKSNFEDYQIKRIDRIQSQTEKWIESIEFRPEFAFPRALSLSIIGTTSKPEPDEDEESE